MYDFSVRRVCDIERALVHSTYDEVLLLLLLLELSIQQELLLMLLLLLLLLLVSQQMHEVLCVAHLLILHDLPDCWIWTLRIHTAACQWS